MAEGIKVGMGFKLDAKLNLDARKSFKTLAEMKNFPESSIPEGFTTFNEATGLEYQFLSTNDVDETLGKWRVKVADKSAIITLTKAEYEALATKDPETYYIITDDVDSVTTTSTINSSSTDSEVPTAKAVETRISKREIIKNVDLNTFVSEGKYYIQNECTNSPVDGGYLNVMRYSDDFVCQICTRYHVASSMNMYIRTKFSGTWNAWQRVVTTKVDDVPETTINSLHSCVTSGNVYYQVKNGVCYVSIIAIVIGTDATTNFVLCSGLPKCASKPHHIITDGSANVTSGFLGLVYVSANGDLGINLNRAGTGYCSFSYPVAE